MVEWHHQLSGHEFEQTWEDSEGKPGVLQFHKESDTTSGLNDSILKYAEECTQIGKEI